MLDHLNASLSNKGIKVKRCIITSVKLDEEVASSIQDKTIFQFKNTLERKTFAYKQRIKNDQEEEIKEKQIKEQQRKDVVEQAKLPVVVAVVAEPAMPAAVVAAVVEPAKLAVVAAD